MGGWGVARMPPARGAAATGDGGGCAQETGCGARAGVAGADQRAGAGAVGQGIANDARWGEWPRGYWGSGGVVGWGAASLDAAPETRAEASSAKDGREATRGGATSPGTR